MRATKDGAGRNTLVQGTLDMFRTLPYGAAHGHDIARHIHQTTDDVLQVEHGSLCRPKLDLVEFGVGDRLWKTRGSVERSGAGSIFENRAVVDGSRARSSAVSASGGSRRWM